MHRGPCGGGGRGIRHGRASRATLPSAARVDATFGRSYAGPSDGAPDAKEHDPRDAGSMTASEFSFLALGLIIGAVSGAALVEIIRARPPAAREVRVTVSPNAIPRRAATLADDAFVFSGPEPARGGPADRRFEGDPHHVDGPERRTAVRFDEPAPTPGGPSMAGAIPISPDPSATPIPGRIPVPSQPPADGPLARRMGPNGPSMAGAIPVSTGRDPVLDRFREGSPQPIVTSTPPIEARSAPPPPPTASNRAAVDRPPGPMPARPVPPGLAAAVVAVLDRPAVRAVKNPLSRGAAKAPPAIPEAKPAATERCAEERRIAAERCELATRARSLADAAADALRLAQRTYDAHEAAAVTASWRADPRAVHESKEAAQARFRSAVAAAPTAELLEAAARDWLGDINRINTDARDATITVTRERAAAAQIGATLERLGLEADAARIGAENADASCLAARSVEADCDERATTDTTFLIPPMSGSDETPHLDDDETLGLAFESGGAPRIFRLLQGDRVAMTTLVAALAGDDPDERRRWQLLLTNLVEAIVADAIEASALEFPDGHPFWGSFTRPQDRDIVHALGSLGYKFDGLGGWIDDRQPSQRDLSMALGYAGLDPMRIRQWPNADATAALFKDVTVAADEYLASVAGDLTLAEMVGMLGRRADGLAEAWNHWGTIRPLLLDES